MKFQKHQTVLNIQPVYKENKMSENNDELENKIVDSEEFKRMKHLAGLEEADWDDDDD